jgi:3-hydroxyisobutyrate dehydrogenase-like beta-hydroxyacid dehydrogenase
MPEVVGFVGLGKMGQAIASRLMEAGFALRVWNRTPERARPLGERGAQIVGTPREAAPRDGIVFTMVSDDEALEAVSGGEDGILAGLGAGVHISMSTVAPETARRQAAAHERQGAAYLAAPVFGRPDAAAAGKLWVVVAGDAAAKERAQPVFAGCSQGVYDFGAEVAAANIVKLAGNFLIASAMEAMGEAFALGEKNGVDRSSMAALFGETLFACPVYRNYGNVIAQKRYEPAGFRLALGHKDVRLVYQSGEASQVPLPLASLLRDRLLRLRAQGYDDIDWSGLALAASHDAGLE